MSVHPEAALLELALGTASPKEAAVVTAHILRCGSCAGLLRAFQETLKDGGDERVPLPSPESVWSRLHNLVEGPERFAALAGELASFLRISEETARAGLSGIDGLQWQPGLAEGVRVAPFGGGHGLGRGKAFVLRMSPGAVYPHHAHQGVEHVFVLQGGFLEDNGRELWRGDSSVAPAGSAHSLTILDGPECFAIVAVVSAA